MWTEIEEVITLDECEWHEIWNIVGLQEPRTNSINMAVSNITETVGPQSRKFSPGIVN